MRAPPNKPRLIHWPGVLRFLVYVVVAFALIAAAALLPHRARPPVAATRLAAPSRSVNPLMRELARCQNLGAKAEDDLACLKAWSKNRRHFFDGDINDLPRVRADKATRSASQP
jgi:conjugative transfer region protein TrbK